jgi:hypothetical protein
MKIKMPKISRKDNYQLIMLFILLVVVIFITAMPWVSNTFHEALENITPSRDDILEDVNDTEQEIGEQEIEEPEIREEELEGYTGVNYQDDEEREGYTGVNEDEEEMEGYTGVTYEDDEEREGFTGNSLFRNTATTFPQAVVDTRRWNTTVNTEEDLSAPLDRNSLYMFNNANFSPNCCGTGPGSGMSTSMGCACLSNSDAFFITEGRGGGNMNPTAII